MIVTAFFTCLLIAVGVLNVRDRVAWVDAYDGVFWVETDNGLTAETVAPDGPGYQAGVRVGDLLIAIDGRKTPGLGVYAESLYNAGPGVRLDYTVLTAAGVRNLPVFLEARNLFTARDGVKTLLAFLYLGIGVFVALRAPAGAEKAIVRLFYFFCLTAFVLWGLSYTPALGALDLCVYALSAAAFLILPAILIHFCLRFADTRRDNRIIAALIYVPSGLLCLLHLLWAAGDLAPLGFARTVVGGSVLDRIEIAYFGAAFLAGGWILLKRHLRTDDLVVRQQMKWIGYGVLAGTVPFGMVYIIPAFLGVKANFVMETSALFLALIPLSVGYAVLRYRLMDVEDIARRSLACLLAAVILILFPVITALIFNFYELPADLPRHAGIMIASMTTLALVLLFAPLRRMIQTRLDSAFYRNNFKDRRTLLDFARALSAEISLEPLARNISERIVRAFPVDRAALLAADPARPDFFRFVDGVNCAAASQNLFLRADDLPEGGASFGLTGLKNGPEYLCRAGAALFREGFSFRQDLRFQGRRVGTLALGELPRGRHFSSEDIELLSAMAGYAAIALENAALYSSARTQALELERLKNYTENILESIDVAVVAITAGGRVGSCNRAFENLYGAARNQITGALANNLFAADVIASIRIAAGMTGWEAAAPASIFKLSMKNLNGRTLIVNLNIQPLRNFEGFTETFMDDASGCLLVMEDITEKTQLEEQLMQAEKLSSLGLLAAGVAHEINTPLTGISSYAQILLKENGEDAERRREILEKIEKQTFRASEIVGGLLSFSKLGGNEFTAVDINQVIHDSLSLLDHQFDRSRVKVTSDLGEDIPPVYGNTGKLQQVFVNLFLNARDAMPSGGELGIQTAMGDSTVVVDISDTGGGISQENLKRIFDPFFTTKGIGKGTGLGLAVSYGIIQEHGGGIFVESDAGKGTRFTLKLPARLN
jgi:PAS domain S-box-containing protein